MRACVFLRRSGAMGLGHVGWAFEQRDGLFYTGAVENPSGSPVAHPNDIGFWSVKTKDPVGQMRKRSYDSYKVIGLNGGNHVRAWSKVIQVKKSWYTLLFGNCMDDTYNVLRAYGVHSMPLPAASVTPNNWFDSLKWSYYPVGLQQTSSPEASSGMQVIFDGNDEFMELSDVPYDD